MAWLAVDKNGSEFIYDEFPKRDEEVWDTKFSYIPLPQGSIKKLIGRDLIWEDEPVEI